MNKRRAQAVTLGLIRGNTTFEEDGTDRTEYYELTPLGKAIRWKIRRLGLDRVYWRLLELEDQFADSKTEAISWVTDDYDEVEERHEYFFKLDDAEPGDDRDEFWK